MLQPHHQVLTSVTQLNLADVTWRDFSCNAHAAPLLAVGASHTDSTRLDRRATWARAGQPRRAQRLDPPEPALRRPAAG
jgi:hypothetical protein